MSWASIANNQCVSLANLQDAVNNGVFTLKNTIPVSNKETTKGEAEFYVNINPISKATSQLVVKSNLVANNSTTTTTTTTTPPIIRYALAGTTGNLYISNNAGFNWGTVPFFNGFEIEKVKMSSSGQYMLVLAYDLSTIIWSIYLSSNYGSSWTNIVNNVGSEVYDIAISDNGQYIVYVVRNGQVYRSTNSGSSFSTTGSPGVSSWRGVSMSSSGQYITLVSFNSFIWKSTDYGNSYISRTGVVTSWECIAMSSNGQYQVAGRGEAGLSGTQTLYRSTDFGSTWSGTGFSIGNGVGVVSLSGDGQYGLTFRNFGGTEIYRTTNFGASWSLLTTIGSSGNGNWSCSSISPDNGVQLVGANGNIWPTNEIWRSVNAGMFFAPIAGTNTGWTTIAVGN